MSDDKGKTTSSVSEGQASPPAGESEDRCEHCGMAYDDGSVGAECSRLEDDLLRLHDVLAEAGLPGAINAESIEERIERLLHAGGSVGPEQADVAVLPEAVSGAEVERLRAIEQAARPFAALADEVDRLRHPDDSTCPHRLRAGDLRALRAALSEGERHG